MVVEHSPVAMHAVNSVWASSPALSTDMPVVFVSHGSPMWAVEPGAAGEAWQRIGRAMRADYPGLRAVLVLSPHWMERQPLVMTHPQPATWHDFGGFPEELYRLQYPAPGAPEVALEVLGMLAEAGLPAQPDPQRPFDHGAWVPLMHMFPQADVPVLQLALPASYGPRESYALGRALRGLRQRGVWLLGSGGMTHNIREYFERMRRGQTGEAAYEPRFRAWVQQALLDQDRERLFNYREQAPDGAFAHPTEEHFMPLFFVLGAADWAEPGVPETRCDVTELLPHGHLVMGELAVPPA